MDQLLQRFKDKRPEIVFEWSDHETGAEGWIVINSLRGGAAGGGTRMRKGLDKSEVESLAKTMEIKFTVSGPAIGGAKSGINFDPNDPRKEEVLKKWYTAASALLKRYYGTGGDMNVDEVKDVIPITEDLGLWHPQEGIVNGHFNPSDAAKIHMIGQLRQGVSKMVEDPTYAPTIEHKFCVADLITGFGVYKAVEHYYELFRKTDVSGKRCVIQGWGNVAGIAAYYLARHGAKIVGIIDKDGGLIDSEGMDYEAVRKLIHDRQGNKLAAPDMLSFDEVNDRIWDLEADIFIPAAASKLVTREQIQRLIFKGLEVVSSGANVPFKDEDVFFGETAKYADGQLSIIPDFIANCGMARTFAYLMQEEVEISDRAIFEDVSAAIRNALVEVHNFAPENRHIAANALNIALQKLV